MKSTKGKYGAADSEQTIEQRIDHYVRNYSVRTLAEMLVDLEDRYARKGQ